MAKQTKLSSRVALGGIVAGLCIVTMILSGVIPALYILAPMVAGFLMIILAEEVSTGWAWLTYTAVSLLALFVTFDKEAALMFILFFGYYPILRRKFEGITSNVLRWIVKYILYNVFLAIDFLLTTYVLGLPTYTEDGMIMAAATFVMFNFVFCFYDRILAQKDWFYKKYFVDRIIKRRG
ncbi:MAG: hypothetical protein MJ071_05690 [Oscillospiraceae bacterium]|nr:hypothetical protein [Oscillospiraceae bacterium]